MEIEQGFRRPPELPHQAQAKDPGKYPAFFQGQEKDKTPKTRRIQEEEGALKNNQKRKLEATEWKETALAIGKVAIKLDLDNLGTEDMQQSTENTRSEEQQDEVSSKDKARNKRLNDAL